MFPHTRPLPTRYGRRKASGPKLKSCNFSTLLPRLSMLGSRIYISLPMIHISSCLTNVLIVWILISWIIKFSTLPTTFSNNTLRKFFFPIPISSCLLTNAVPLMKACAKWFSYMNRIPWLSFSTKPNASWCIKINVYLSISVKKNSVLSCIVNWFTNIGNSNPSSSPVAIVSVWVKLWFIRCWATSHPAFSATWISLPTVSTNSLDD